MLDRLVLDVPVEVDMICKEVCRVEVNQFNRYVSARASLQKAR